MDLISECRIYSRLKFRGRRDYFYQCCNESNCPVLCPLHHLSCPSLGPTPNVNFLVPTSVLVHARTPADDFSVCRPQLYHVVNYCSPTVLLEQSLSLRIFIFYQYMAVTREGNMSYLSLTFLCEFRVYLSMEICTKKLQMEYLPTFLIHDRHLAKQEDDVNKKMIFKWTPGFCVSRSWQTREQLLAYLWDVNSPIPGPALCLGTGRVLHHLRRQQLWVNSFRLPSQPLAPHLHPSVWQVPEALGCLVCSPTSMPFSAKDIHLFSLIHSFLHG